MTESWEFAGRNRLSKADLAKQEKQAAPVTPHILRRRTGSSTTSRIPTRKSSDSTGCAATTSEDGRSCGAAILSSSDLDFEANARDGVAIDWPIRFADIVAVVRLRRALCRHQRQPRGTAATARRPVPAADGDELPRAPGEGRIAKSFGGRAMIIGRVANLTQPHNGRGGCQ